MSTGVDYFSSSVTNHACSCGTTYFQETYPEQLFKDCSHYRGVISEADQMLMNDAERVTILTGAGCEGSHDELLQIAEHCKHPSCMHFSGKEFVEYDNPYDVGMTGLFGFTSGYRAMMNCDLILPLGTDFPYPQFYLEKAKGWRRCYRFR